MSYTPDQEHEDRKKNTGLICRKHYNYDIINVVKAIFCINLTNLEIKINYSLKKTLKGNRNIRKSMFIIILLFILNLLAVRLMTARVVCLVHD